MHRARVKFCGLTDVDDAVMAADLGADAVGMVFYPPAKTAVDIAVAKTIAQKMPAFVAVVALFVNPQKEFAREIINTVGPHLLQFHGDEDEEFCRSFAMPYLKVCRVKEAADIHRACKNYPGARAVLLDSFSQHSRGGSGQTFDWKLIPKKHPHPLIVAGGVSAESVGDLITAHRPWGVDVSSGISQTNNRRRKDKTKMKKFMEQVNGANKTVAG